MQGQSKTSWHLLVYQMHITSKWCASILLSHSSMFYGKHCLFIMWCDNACVLAGIIRLGCLGLKTGRTAGNVLKDKPRRAKATATTSSSEESKWAEIAFPGKEVLKGCSAGAWTVVRRWLERRVSFLGTRGNGKPGNRKPWQCTSRPQKTETEGHYCFIIRIPIGNRPAFLSSLHNSSSLLLNFWPSHTHMLFCSSKSSHQTQYICMNI